MSEGLCSSKARQNIVCGTGDPTSTRVQLSPPSRLCSSVPASLWNPAPNQPQWGWFHGLLDHGTIELITVGTRGGGDATVTPTPIRPPRRHTWAIAPNESTQQRLRAAAECLQETPAGLPNTY